MSSEVARNPALQRQLIETSNAPLGGSAEAFERMIADERAAHRRWLRRDGRA